MIWKRAAFRTALLLGLVIWVLVGWRLLAPPLALPELPPLAQDMVFCHAGTRLSSGHEAARTVNALWVDRFEVTRHDYASHLVEVPAAADPARGLTAAALQSDGDLPITRVTLHEARTFAARRGKRLPAAIEWDWCAAGPANLRYPWGDAESTTPLANTLEAGLGMLAPVGMFEGGRSRFGAYDLAGNAAEWTETPQGLEAPDRFFIKGGSFLDPARDRTTMLTALDSWMPTGSGWTPVPWRLAGASSWFSDTGFRCVLDVEAAALDQRLRELVQRLGVRDPWGWMLERRTADEELLALGAACLPHLDHAAAVSDERVAAHITALASRIRRGGS